MNSLQLYECGLEVQKNPVLFSSYFASAY